MASLFSEEEEATKVARIIKSCDDGGFKRYKVGVRKITGPVFDVAFRTVGRQVKYAVEVDIAW